MCSVLRRKKEAIAVCGKCRDEWGIKKEMEHWMGEILGDLLEMEHCQTFNAIFGTFITKNILICYQIHPPLELRVYIQPNNPIVHTNPRTIRVGLS